MPCRQCVRRELAATAIQQAIAMTEGVLVLVRSRPEYDGLLDQTSKLYADLMSHLFPLEEGATQEDARISLKGEIAEAIEIKCKLVEHIFGANPLGPCEGEEEEPADDVEWPEEVS